MRSSSPTGSVTNREGINKKIIIFLVILLVLSMSIGVILSVYFGLKCKSNVSAEGVDSTGAAILTEDAKDNLELPLITDVRLPRHIIPIHYTVRLLPFLEEDNFTTLGYVRIEMRCEEETSKIVLHNADSRIDHQSVKIVKITDGGDVLIDRMEEDVERQFFTIHLFENLVETSIYVLTMDFTGFVNDQQRGLFRMSYMEDGIKKYLAVTQMEPVDARRAFPCLDEPSFKAEFSIILGRKEHMKSLSNMPKIRTQPIEGLPGYYWDHFERSVPMSSYLVAMCVADFSFVEAKTDEGIITFRLWARHSAINQTKYGLEMGAKMLHFFEDYFGIPYPLPKQDMIALPDFPGAMENWGLITYGEQHLLYDPDVPSDSNRELVAQVIAHEQAHQWFGNLVTMDWWNDLWLNEGFASYLSYIGANHFEPSYKLGQQFVVNELQTVMGVDGLITSHPISQPVHHPDEIGQIFDRISYNKGATVIRMLAEFLGHATFQRGLSYYLKHRVYGNAVQDDLWAALTYQASLDSIQLPAEIKLIMDSWTLKMGYPVVNITRDYSTGTLIARQERFLLDSRSISNNGHCPNRWWVPLTYTWQNNVSHILSAWIPEESDEVDILLPDVGAEQWIIFNVDQVGYYRVNYDQRNWNLIAGQLLNKVDEVPVINRAQLIDDAFNLARSGRLDYSVALNLSRYLRKETELIPWKSASTALKFLDAMLCRTSVYGAFQDYVGKLVDGLFHHVNGALSVEDPLRANTRTVAWRLACHFQHRGCLGNAAQLYTNWMENPDRSIVPAYLRTVVSCTAVAHGGMAEWDFARRKFNMSNHANEKDDLLEAMCCSNQAWIINRMLEWTLDGTLSKSESISLYTHLARQPLGRYMTFDFFKGHWDLISNSFRTGTSTFAGILDVATESFNTILELDKIHEVFQGKPKGRVYQQVLERIQTNILWMRRNQATIVRWLHQQQ